MISINYCVITINKSLTTVPVPTVSITAPNNQTLGQSLRLECNGTTVRGVNRVDIVWIRDGTVVKFNTRVRATTTINNLLVYRVSYTIPQLNTSDEGVMYKCRLAVRGSSRVRVDDTITLNVTGECFSVKMNDVLHSLHKSVVFW